jgi:hypothetical protein
MIVQTMRSFEQMECIVRVYFEMNTLQRIFSDYSNDNLTSKT